MTNTLKQAEAIPITLTVSTQELRDALKKVIKTTARSGGVFRGVLLRVSDDGLSLTGADGWRALTCRIEYAGRPLPAALVGARLLINTVKLHDEDGRTVLTAEDEHLAVAQGSRVVRLRKLPAGDYPNPHPEAPAVFELSETGLRHIAERVVPAASDDETLPRLGCVRLQARAGRLRAIATDRYRLVVQDEPVRDLAHGRTVDLLVPAPSLRLLAQTVGRTAETVTVGVAAEHLVAATSREHFSARLLISTETIPEPERFIPTPELTVVLDRDQTLTELKAVTLAVERRTPVRLTIQGDQMRLQAGSDDQAMAETVVPVRDGPAEPFAIAFNPANLADALASFPKGQIVADLTARSGVPAQFTSPSQAGYRHLLMPVRLSQ